VDQRRAHARRGNRLSRICCDVFVAEVPDGGQHRVGRGLAESAKRRVLDHLAQFDEAVDVIHLAMAFADAVARISQHSLGPHAAGHAFAARFFLDELQEEAGHVHHAGVLVHHDQAARTHDRAEFLPDDS
jgi:hypothetical protein